jgi:hypothetical protein
VREGRQVTLNRYRYIERFEVAVERAALINSGGVGAEPGPWFTWLIVRYA